MQTGIPPHSQEVASQGEVTVPSHGFLPPQQYDTSAFPVKAAEVEGSVSSNNSAPSEKNLCTSITAFVRHFIPYGGLVSSCFSLASVTLGGGIISMPSSFATSGILMAVIYLVVITILTVYTMLLLGYAMKATGCRSLEHMGFTLLGRGGGYFAGGVMAVSCSGTAIGYISAAGSLVDPILKKSPGTPAYLKTENGNRLIVTLIWLCLLLPIITPKRINSIRYVSMVGCSMVLYFVTTIVIHSSTNGLQKGMRGDMKLFTTGNQAIYALPIFVFAYMCQGVTFSVFYEMKPMPSVRQLTLASAIALTICMFFYILAGFFGYMDFADETQDSILYNFDPVHQPYMMIAYIGMLVKICAAFAMNMIPIRNFGYYCLGWDLETLPYWKHILYVGTASALALVAGLFIPTLNLAFGLVGSLCGGFIGFIFPAVFWMYCGNWTLHTVGIWHYLGTHLLLITGVVSIVFGTIATVYSSFLDTDSAA